MATRDSSRAPGWVTPMLAKPDGGRLHEGPEWAYEYKLDGYRACMQIASDGTTVLTSRNGIDFTYEFADLTGVLAPALDGQPAVLDGEIVVYNDAEQIDFGLMQERRGRYQTHQSSPRRAEPFEDVPVQFLAFDLLLLGTKTLPRELYEQRRGQLAGLAMPDPYRVSVVRGFTSTELAVLAWLTASAAEFGVDRIGVGGASAGGNLAALVSAHRGPALDHQVLEVPAVTLDVERDESNRRYGELTGTGDLPLLRAAYLSAGPVAGWTEPAQVPDLTGQPPTLVITAECDALRDSGQRYAARLAARASGTVLAAYFAGSVVTALVFSWISDRTGTRKLIVWTSTLFIAGGLLGQPVRPGHAGVRAGDRHRRDGPGRFRGGRHGDADRAAAGHVGGRGGLGRDRVVVPAPAAARPGRRHSPAGDRRRRAELLRAVPRLGRRRGVRRARRASHQERDLTGGRRNARGPTPDLIAEDRCLGKAPTTELKSCGRWASRSCPLSRTSSRPDVGRDPPRASHHPGGPALFHAEAHGLGSRPPEPGRTRLRRRALGSCDSRGGWAVSRKSASPSRLGLSSIAACHSRAARSFRTPGTRSPVTTRTGSPQSSPRTPSGWRLRGTPQP